MAVMYVVRDGEGNCYNSATEVVSYLDLGYARAFEDYDEAKAFYKELKGSVDTPLQLVAILFVVMEDSE